MTISEQHEMLCGILCKLVEVLDADELSLLSHHCGIPVSEWYYPKAEQVAAVETRDWRVAA